MVPTRASIHHANAVRTPVSLAVAEQSVAGATQTSTHGTGRKLGSLSTALVSLTLVLANASLVEVSASKHPEIFAAASVGLGSLGVVVEAEVRVVPSFKLRRTEMPWDLDALVEALPALNARYERLQWWPRATRTGSAATGAPAEHAHARRRHAGTGHRSLGMRRCCCGRRWRWRARP